LSLLEVFYWEKQSYGTGNKNAHGFHRSFARSIDRSAIGRAANSYIWKMKAAKTKSMSSCCLIERIYKQDFAWIIFFFKDSPNEYISPSIFFSIMAAEYEKSLFAKFGDTST